ncbi:MAG TPA: hypothetical protein VFF64_11260 [Candidatus Eremiobacteraceae bacterium]|nr:hypothetical protein [Candidatus Eremiobacteraceae bacterium]
MNTRRSNHKLKATGTASVADRTALREEDFLRVIWHERKRAERCQKPCLLMLVEMESQFPLERNGKALATVLSALSAATRETDVTGWYKDDRVVGVLFTEINFEDGASIVTTVMTRVSETLRKGLSSGQFNQASVSFHLFPEERDEQIPAAASNRASYPGLAARADLAGRDDSRRLVQR